MNQFPSRNGLAYRDRLTFGGLTIQTPKLGASHPEAQPRKVPIPRASTYSRRFTLSHQVAAKTEMIGHLHKVGP